MAREMPALKGGIFRVRAQYKVTGATRFYGPYSTEAVAKGIITAISRNRRGFVVCTIERAEVGPFEEVKA